ncbi:hypothetical protein [Falsiroseomonas sp. E2-1-a4]|uniref:hypothetical protein n=1 Tax=Falsiroseomonas sp. E2-1-a4 TaxID=3239299 RepID=UPI003F3833A6
MINRHRAPASRFQRFLAGVPNTRAAAFRQSATEVGVETLITIAISTTTATFMADFCFNGQTDVTPTDRAVTLAANRGLGWMLDTSQEKEFALAGERRVKRAVVRAGVRWGGECVGGHRW